MNQQIRELAKQAWIEGGNEVHSGSKTAMEKFAELIVLECSAFVYNYPEKYLTRNQAREICIGMEEHFGVEE